MTDNVFKQYDHMSPTMEAPATAGDTWVDGGELAQKLGFISIAIGWARVCGELEANPGLVLGKKLKMLLEEHCRAHVAAYTILFLDGDLTTDDDDGFDYGSEQESCWGPGQNGETWGSDI